MTSVITNSQEITGPRELDLYTFYNIRNENKLSKVKKSMFVLQYLGSHGTRTNIFLRFSDGNVVENIAPSSCSKAKMDQLKPNDIVEADIIYHKEKLMVLINFKIIYSRVEEIIGQPITYNQFVMNKCQNRRGKTSISKSIVVKKEEYHSSEDEDWDMEEEIENPEVSENEFQARFKGVDVYTKLRELTKRTKSFAIKVRCVEKMSLRTF